MFLPVTLFLWARAAGEQRGERINPLHRLTPLKIYVVDRARCRVDAGAPQDLSPRTVINILELFANTKVLLKNYGQTSVGALLLRYFGRVVDFWYNWKLTIVFVRLCSFFT